MPVARVVQLSSVVILVALALSGCMRRPVPVAALPPAPGARGDLDNMAYGPAPGYRGPVGPRVVMAAPMAAPPIAYAATPVAYDGGYHLDAGDRLRVVVYGQDGLSNSYAVDASGNITMPLIGTVPARGCTPAELARSIADKLRNGFVREPYVAAEVEAYRPFFILGEVAAPGQYPYVPNMTAESAVAIAGGYTPRAKRNIVKLTRSNQVGSVTAMVPALTPLQPGDTVAVGERWF